MFISVIPNTLVKKDNASVILPCESPINTYKRFVIINGTNTAWNLLLTNPSR